VDETGCDEEVYFLCAQATINASVHCLAAMDATRGSAKAKAQACANAEGGDFSKVDACFNSDQAATLKSAAAKYFDGKFPQPVGVPHIEIQGKAQTDRSKASLIKQLCATGIEAGACKGFIQTASGLQYRDIIVGTGENPVKGQIVKVHYTGRLDDGSVFDSSIPRGQPLAFPVGTGRVIPGWDEGIVSMRVGGKRQLKIPPELGYGREGTPGGPIPPNATLLFDCELVDLGPAPTLVV